MKQFAALFNALDASTATSAKVAALRAYFDTASDADAAWAVYFLAGGRPRQALDLLAGIALLTLAAKLALS